MSSWRPRMTGTKAATAVTAEEEEEDAARLAACSSEYRAVSLGEQCSMKWKCDCDIDWLVLIRSDSSSRQV